MRIIKNKFSNSILSAGFIMSMSVQAGPLDISDVPLELTPAVAPNILIVSDDTVFFIAVIEIQGKVIKRYSL